MLRENSINISNLIYLQGQVQNILYYNCISVNFCRSKIFMYTNIKYVLGPLSNFVCHIRLDQTN